LDNRTHGTKLVLMSEFFKPLQANGPAVQWGPLIAE